MLPKRRRILRKEFTNILKNGRRFHSPSLILCVAPISSGGTSDSKVSFSVSKKVCQKAVNRNKYRRRGYSIILKNLKKIKPGYFFLFSFKKTPELLTFSTLEKDVTELLSMSGVLI